MSRVILKPETSIEDLINTLGLISLKVAKLHSNIEVVSGDDHLTAKQKILFDQLYHIANRHFIDDSGDDSLGKLYGDDEMEKIKSSLSSLDKRQFELYRPT